VKKLRYDDQTKDKEHGQSNGGKEDEPSGSRSCRSQSRYLGDLSFRKRLRGRQRSFAHGTLRIRAFQVAHEPVTAPPYGLNEQRFFGGVSQRIPQLAYGYCEAMVEIDKGILRPEAIAKFFPSDDFAH
jgi:hypothetical protein